MWDLSLISASKMAMPYSNDSLTTSLCCSVVCRRENLRKDDKVVVLVEGILSRVWHVLIWRGRVINGSDFFVIIVMITPCNYFSRLAFKYGNHFIFQCFVKNKGENSSILLVIVMIHSVQFQFGLLLLSLFIHLLLADTCSNS